jgi:precorrin-2 dehydrogenase / sirohydrochlorin ferrochelatase
VPVDAPLYPVGLVVAGRPVLVVGGGRVAARKVADLVACGAQVTVVAPEVVPALAERGDVAVERRPYRAGEAAGYRLVVTATGDRAVDQQVFDDAEAAGVWVNSADDPERCTFTLPAVVRHDPVVVAVATGGHSPALATWLRRRLSSQLGPEVAVLAALLGEARDRVRASGRSTEDLDWQALLDGGLLDVLVAEGEDAARTRIDTWLAGP